MIDINELRRLTQAALAGPDGISLNWLKLLQDFQQKVSPAAVSELLDRLEAAEKERNDVAQQLVQSEVGKREISEAHNAVTRRLSVLADENAALRAEVIHWKEQREPGAAGWRALAHKLRAKIERMENMKAALRQHHKNAMGEGFDPSHPLTKLRVSAYQQTCLYADTIAALEEPK